MTPTARRARDGVRPVPLWIITHRDLTATAVRLYMLLDIYLAVGGPAGPERAMEDLGIGEAEQDLVADGIRQLRAAGAIDVERAPDERAPDGWKTVITVHQVPPDGFEGVRNLDDVPLFPSTFELYREEKEWPV